MNNRQIFSLVPAHKRGALIITLGDNNECQFTLFRDKNQHLKCHVKYAHFRHVTRLAISHFINDYKDLLTRIKTDTCNTAHFKIQTRFDVKSLDAGVKNRYPNGMQKPYIS